MHLGLMSLCGMQEDALLIEGHNRYGNKWTEIAKVVGGR